MLSFTKWQIWKKKQSWERSLVHVVHVQSPKAFFEDAEAIRNAKQCFLLDHKPAIASWKAMASNTNQESGIPGDFQVKWDWEGSLKEKLGGRDEWGQGGREGGGSWVTFKSELNFSLASLQTIRLWSFQSVICKNSLLWRQNELLTFSSWNLIFSRILYLA